MRKKKKQQIKEKMAKLDSTKVNEAETLEDEMAILERRIARKEKIFQVVKDDSAVSKKMAYENTQISPHLKEDLTEKKERETAFAKW